MNCFLFSPEILLSLGAAALLGLTLAEEPGRSRAARLAAIAFSALAAAAAFCTALARPHSAIFSGSYHIDLFSQCFKFLFASALLATAVQTNPEDFPRRRGPEFFLFLSGSALGMSILASAAEALTFYAGLELSSYCLYILAAMRRDGRTAESGIKYILFGAGVSGLLLYGLSLLIGICGTPYFVEMVPRIAERAGEPALVLAFFMILTALFFKLSLAPFHFWAPDLYETAPMPVTVFVATASKAAALAILLRFFSFLGLPSTILPAVAFFAFISMTLGNAAALVQKDMKRLLAYSSIAQAGYAAVGLAAAGADAYDAVFFYAVAYLVMNLAAFLVVWQVARASGKENPSIDDFDGLAERSPLLALVLLVSLLSLAGIPPLAGFAGKWLLFAAAMKKGLLFLVLAGVLNSVVSLYYYLTIIRHAYLLKPRDPKPYVLDAGTRAGAFALFAALMLMGAFPQIIVEIAHKALGAW